MAREDWRFVTGLPELADLFLNPDELAALAAEGIRLEKVRTVGLACHDRSPGDLRHVITAFPEMTTLNVYFADELDLAPLATHPRLTLVNTMGARLLNADELSVRFRLNPPSEAHPED